MKCRTIKQNRFSTGSLDHSQQITNAFLDPISNPGGCHTSREAQVTGPESPCGRWYCPGIAVERIDAWRNTGIWCGFATDDGPTSGNLIQIRWPTGLHTCTAHRQHNQGPPTFSPQNKEFDRSSFQEWLWHTLARCETPHLRGKSSANHLTFYTSRFFAAMPFRDFPVTESQT